MTEPTKAPQTKSLFQPAVKYPEDIFTPAKPDETQQLADTLNYLTAFKGWRTRSEIYERVFPDGENMALRIDGPRGAGCFMTYRNDGGIRIGTGPLNTEIAGSCVLGLYSEGGTNQKHLSTSYYEYNMGGTASKGIALSIKATGDVVEECEGGQHSIKATKILITATDQLEIDGQNILIAAQGDLQLQGASVNTITVNQKDIVTGQKMNFGAGEETSMQFDPRANISVVSTGHVNHRILGDYNLETGGVMHMKGAGGTFAAPLITDNRQFGLRMNTLTKSLYGGNVSAQVNAPIVKVGGEKTPGIVKVNATDYSLDTSGKADMTIQGTSTYDVTGKMDIKGTDIEIKGAKTVVEGTGSLDLKSTGNVNITGALIYLN